MRTENLSESLNRRDILLQSTALVAAAGMTAGATLPVYAAASDQQGAIPTYDTRVFDYWHAAHPTGFVSRCSKSLMPKADQ